MPPTEFQKIPIVPYDMKSGNYGLVRCSICFKDFKSGDRLKQFPASCQHLFHIKCLELWTSFEANCAHCLTLFTGFKTPMQVGLSDDFDTYTYHQGDLSTNNTSHLTTIPDAQRERMLPETVFL